MAEAARVGDRQIPAINFYGLIVLTRRAPTEIDDKKYRTDGQHASQTVLNKTKHFQRKWISARTAGDVAGTLHIRLRSSKVRLFVAL